MNFLTQSLAPIAALAFSVAAANAATFGDFTYTDDGSSITLTDYPDNATGSVVIPASIDGKPVTRIEDDAFLGCSGLTSISIPSSVTSIGYTAFRYCSGLTSVTIPALVTSIDEGAFSYCSNLGKATFLGNAPALNDPATVFRGAAPLFKVYYYEGKAGFSVPTWHGYPIAAIYDRPEIGIQQPKGSNLVDGSAKKSFGSLLVDNKSLPKSFTIQNVGTKTLKGLSITINGLNAKDFIVTQPLKTSLPGGASTTFKVSFKPTAKGTRNAVIHVKSNDANENTFDIKLVGLGMK